MSFKLLLNLSCDIEEYTVSQDAYGKKDKSWSVRDADIPCRKENVQREKLLDNKYRVTVDDFLFFFEGDTTIARGDRIKVDQDYYSVIGVQVIYNSTDIHHLEVYAMISDHE